MQDEQVWIVLRHLYGQLPDRLMGSRRQTKDGANSRLPDRRYEQNRDNPRSPRQLRHREGDQQKCRRHSREGVPRYPRRVGVAKQIESDGAGEH